jgi:hypothetical protein
MRPLIAKVVMVADSGWACSWRRRLLLDAAIAFVGGENTNQ